jgi:adenylate kinase family enzyme
MKKTCIVLIGGPCSGKSSIGKYVASATGATYISSGDIARRMAEENKDVNDNLNNGKLAPEESMRNAIYMEIYKQILDETKSVIILDGFPRFGDQADWLHNKFNKCLDFHYILIQCPYHILKKRAKSRCRSDDGSIEERLSYYYYTTLDNLKHLLSHQIDTDHRSIQECSESLIRYMKEVIQC